MAKSIQQQYIAWIKENLDIPAPKRLAAFREETGYDGPRLKVKTYYADGTPKSVAIFKSETSGTSQRLADLKKQEQEYIDTFLEAGYSQEDAEDALKRHKKHHRGLANSVRDLNKEHGSHSFSLGHGTAVKEGGGDFMGNERLEIGKSKDGKRGNFSRSANDELTDSVKPLIGQPRSGRGGRDSALMDILELENPGIMDTGLTPQDKQRIRANPELANDIMAERQAAIKLNPKAKAPNRLSRGLIKVGKGAAKFIPGSLDDAIIGGTFATIAAGGTLLTGGTAAQAGDAFKNTALDIATGDLDGGTIADGTGGDERTQMELQRAKQAAEEVPWWDKAAGYLNDIGGAIHFGI